MKPDGVHRVGRERGSTSVEAVGLAFPALLAVVLLSVFAFRLVAGQLAVTSAASAAARAASLARTPQAADAAALTAASADLAGHRRTCQTLSVTLEAGAFGRGGQAVVTLTCRISTAGLVGVALPGTVVRTATARAPIDVYRTVSLGPPSQDSGREGS